MGKRILFIGPMFMDIYKDIMTGMCALGYEVDFIAERSLMDDPYNVRGYRGLKRWAFVNESRFLRKNEVYWKNLLSEPAYSKAYDYLFVLDGQSIHPVIFSELKYRNPQLYSVNYLFDTTKGVYRFDKHFLYFDRVFTFDREEAAKYGLSLLPIYWTNEEEMTTEKRYAFFGLGRYNTIRATLFKLLIQKAREMGLPFYLKLQTEQISYFDLKYLIRRLFGMNKGRISAEEYHSDLITFKPVPLQEFRALTVQSEIIVDTNAPHQDGLTARFMWALGAGQKILTTNKAVCLYDFYTPEQIFIVKDLPSLGQSTALDNFMSSPYVMPDAIRRLVNRYRLDNWLKTLLNES